MLLPPLIRTIQAPTLGEIRLRSFEPHALIAHVKDDDRKIETWSEIVPTIGPGDFEIAAAFDGAARLHYARFLSHSLVDDMGDRKYADEEAIASLAQILELKELLELSREALRLTDEWYHLYKRGNQK